MSGFSFSIKADFSRQLKVRFFFEPLDFNIALADDLFQFGVQSFLRIVFLLPFVGKDGGCFFFQKFLPLADNIRMGLVVAGQLGYFFALDGREGDRSFLLRGMDFFHESILPYPPNMPV